MVKQTEEIAGKYTEQSNSLCKFSADQLIPYIIYGIVLQIFSSLAKKSTYIQIQKGIKAI